MAVAQAVNKSGRQALEELALCLKSTTSALETTAPKTANAHRKTVPAFSPRGHRDFVSESLHCRRALPASECRSKSHAESALKYPSSPPALAASLSPSPSLLEPTTTPCHLRVCVPAVGDHRWLPGYFREAAPSRRLTKIQISLLQLRLPSRLGPEKLDTRHVCDAKLTTLTQQQKREHSGVSRGADACARAVQAGQQ